MKFLDSIPRRIVLVLSAATALAGCSEPAGETNPGSSVSNSVTEPDTLICQKMIINSGKIGSGQSYTTLQRRELSGTQDIWQDYVEFAPKTSITCSFPVPSNAASKSATALSLRLNYRGPVKAEQRWTFSAWDSVASTWVLVGDNAFAADWKWSPAVLNLPAPLGRFLSNGTLQVRYQTASTAADSSQLDELVGLVTWSDTDAGSDGSTSDATGTADAGTTDPAPSVDADAASSFDADAGASSDTGVCAPSCAAKTCGSPDGCGHSCLAGSGCEPPTDAGSASDAATSGDATGTGTWWRPSPGTSWQYQISGTVDTTVNAAVYDIDLFEVPQQTIAALHASGRKVVCYFSAGSFEDYRPDASSFPDSVKGKNVDGWAGEWWLDTRSPIVRDIMIKRMDLSVQKGCDGVDPDLVEAYNNDSGLGLTYADQLDYNKFLATAAHARNLTVLLKNDLGQVKDLLSFFDGAVNEECFQYNECPMLSPFINAGKPVFGVEYQGTASTVCPKANALNFDTLMKKLSLNAYRVSCR